MSWTFYNISDESSLLFYRIFLCCESCPLTLWIRKENSKDVDIAIQVHGYSLSFHTFHYNWVGNENVALSIGRLSVLSFIWYIRRHYLLRNQFNHQGKSRNSFNRPMKPFVSTHLFSYLENVDFSKNRLKYLSS